MGQDPTFAIDTVKTPRSPRRRHLSFGAASSIVSHLGPITRAASTLENYQLVNRGILDTVGVAGPVIMLTRTEQERREKIVDRIVVIGSAFFLAPIHAWTLMRVSAKAKGLPQALMGLSFKALQNTGSLAKAMRVLPGARSSFKLPRASEALRKRIVEAKVNMMIPDLTLECLLLGGVGWITNIYTKLTTGGNRFSGEQKATSRENLDKLYKIEAGYQNNEQWRLLGSLALSIGMPLALGVGIKRALFRPTRPASMLLQTLRKHAHHFDYRDGIWMSMPSLGLVATAQFFGHLFAARNKRELRENAIRETMLNTIFFFGDATWRVILAKGLYKQFKLPSAEHDLRRIQAMRIPKPLKNRWTRIAGKQLLAALILNSATIAAGILINNKLTQKKVESDVEKKLGTTAESYFPVAG